MSIQLSKAETVVKGDFMRGSDRHPRKVAVNRLIGLRIDGGFKDKCSHRADIGTGPAGTTGRSGRLRLEGKHKTRIKPPSDKRYQGMSPG